MEDRPASYETEENGYSNSGNKKLKTSDDKDHDPVVMYKGGKPDEEMIKRNSESPIPKFNNSNKEDLPARLVDSSPVKDAGMYVNDNHSEIFGECSSDTTSFIITEDVTLDETNIECLNEFESTDDTDSMVYTASDMRVEENTVVGTDLAANSYIASCSKVNYDLPSVNKTEEEQPYPCLKKQPVEIQEKEISNYHLKWFDWKGEQTPIVTQNENGPCPLLAIANVLILARKVNLPKMQQLISGKQLMEYIGDCILAETPKQEGNEELLLNYEQNMQDAIDIMHKLQTGIDVNVKFSGVTDFEFTSECIVFDLLKIQLYHGWLVDPQDPIQMEAIGGLSYNQLVEKMLMSKDAEGDKVLEGMVIEDFLARTASQLTYHGLCELTETIQEEELCVFFRNNHFSTLYKHNGQLFLLVTDQGYLTELSVIWETLVNIEGDGQFVNQKFVSVNIQSDGVKSHPDNLGERTMSQEDRDYLIALSLQQELPSQSIDNISPIHWIDNDHKLAMKLQEEENRLAQQHQQHELQQQHNQLQQQQQRQKQRGGEEQEEQPQEKQQQQQSKRHAPSQQPQFFQQPQTQIQQHQLSHQACSLSADTRSVQQTGTTLRSQLQQQQQQQQQQQVTNSQNQQQDKDKDKGCNIL